MRQPGERRVGPAGQLAALVLGLLVPVAGALLTVNMIGAFAFVHAGNGLFADQGGYELVLVLGAASLLLAAVGSGRLGVDHLLLGRQAARTVPERQSA